MNEQIDGKTYYRITYPWRDDDGKEYIVEVVFKTAEDAIAYSNRELFVDPRKFGTPYVVKKELKGKWIDRTFCSNCNWYAKGRYGLAEDSNFPYCPNCGAKMEVDE